MGVWVLWGQWVWVWGIWWREFGIWAMLGCPSRCPLRFGWIILDERVLFLSEKWFVKRELRLLFVTKLMKLYTIRENELFFTQKYQNILKKDPHFLENGKKYDLEGHFRASNLCKRKMPIWLLTFYKFYILCKKLTCKMRKRAILNGKKWKIAKIFSRLNLRKPKMLQLKI